MKSLIILLFLIPLSSTFCQNYLVDITNHPDTGFTYINIQSKEKRINRIEREEFVCNSKKITSLANKHIYKTNDMGNIIEEFIIHPDGKKEKYTYLYDYKGSVIERKHSIIQDKKEKKSSKPKEVKVKYKYKYSYGDCIGSITTWKSNKYSKEEFNCLSYGNSTIIEKKNKNQVTQFRYDSLGNLTEETELQVFTQNETKKITYKYVYNNDKVISVKKTVGQLIYGDDKNYWDYNLEFTKKFLYDESGNVKSILFLNSKDEPFKLYKYNYSYVLNKKEI